MRVHARAYIYTQVYTYTYIHMCIHKYVYVHTRMCTCSHTYTHTTPAYTSRPHLPGALGPITTMSPKGRAPGLDGARTQGLPPELKQRQSEGLLHFKRSRCGDWLHDPTPQAGANIRQVYPNTFYFCLNPGPRQS